MKEKLTKQMRIIYKTFKEKTKMKINLTKKRSYNYFISDSSTCNVLDSTSKPMPSMYVYLNGANNGTTDSNGQKFIDFINVSCDQQQNLSIRCSNNQTRECAYGSSALDFNNDVDSYLFDCNVCKNTTNLKIGLGDVNLNSFFLNNITITLTIHSENVQTNNVIVSFYGLNKLTGLIEETQNVSVNFASNDSSKTINLSMFVKDIDFLQIQVDPNKQVNEPKTDNFVIVPVIRNKEKVQLVVDTNNSKADEAIKEYLRLFVDETTVNPTFIISVGNPIENPNSTIPNSIGNYGWGYDTDKRLIKFNSQQSTNRPYIGLIGRDMSSSPKKIIVYGNRIDGTIAAVKRLVSARNQFLTTLGKSNANYLDDYDTLAIR